MKSLVDREAGFVPAQPLLPSEAEISEFLSETDLEVVVVVEGIDAETSCTIQVREPVVTKGWRMEDGRFQLSFRANARLSFCFSFLP